MDKWLILSKTSEGLAVCFQKGRELMGYWISIFSCGYYDVIVCTDTVPYILRARYLVEIDN